jgi:3',5'-cyclic AMP phosphodiesterase CpdA
VRFSFIHLSDFHFCTEPSRHNVLFLKKRNIKATIDTVYEQVGKLGILSLARPGSYYPPITAGVAQFCHAHKDEINGIIISGDLATTGMATDVEVAKIFVSEPPGAVGFTSKLEKPTLQAAGRPIYVLPGNHDRYANDLARPGAKLFDGEFDAYLPNYDGSVGHQVQNRLDKYIGFVFADFSLARRMDATTKVQSLGQGRVYPEILKNLKSRTLMLRTKYPGIALNWVVHFAPYDCGLGLRLIDWPEVTAAATDLEVLTILCGHTHVQRREPQGKEPLPNHTIYCAASAGSVDNEDDSRVHIVRFDIGDKEVKHYRENYRWSPWRGAFELHSVD